MTHSRKEMPPVPKGDEEVIDHRDTLVSYFLDGCKKPSRWRIGTEHEKFLFDWDSLRPMDYKRGVLPWLEAMRSFGWQPMMEGDTLIALGRDQATITLEPGGQIELSGAPLATLHETCSEVRLHLRESLKAADGIGAGFLGMGFLPQWTRADMPWMPKARYQIMRRYMPKKGNLGLDMMLRTCTIQGNFDYDSEAMMRRCFRLALALQPVAVALFATSPLREGKDSGYLSYRSHIWTDTDPDRCGVPECVFDRGFGFDRYTDYILDVPMYFVRRDGRYIDVAGESFRDFLAGKLPQLPGRRPTIDDWSDHISTVFTEVRLKTFIELRGADCGSVDFLCALSAFWCGLLYDQKSRDAAWDIVRDWSMARHLDLRRMTPRLGLATKIDGRSMLELAREILALSAQGLARRKKYDAKGRDESLYLEPLRDIVDSGHSRAQELLTLWRGQWKNRMRPLYEACAYRAET